MKRFISVLLLVIWLIVIFAFSNQTGEVSGNTSNGILYNTFEIIYDFLNLNKDNLTSLIDLIGNPIRELMHSFEYFVLTLLLVNVLVNFNIDNKVTISIMFIFIAATFDEIHQLFIKGRCFQYFDIFMDMIGCFISIMICKLFDKKKIIN